MEPLRFKEFMQQYMAHDGMEEEKKDIEETLSKLPPSHKALVEGYRWKFHAGNTLNGDDEHVGYIDDGDKEIAVAGPWNYSREYTILHEVAHKVWERLVTPELKHQWNVLFKNAEKKHKALEQSAEEIFCMTYANFYADHKLLTYYKPEWMQFIKNLPS